MGTNFYHYKKPRCEHCGVLDKSTERHIGKSSGGWCFSLHVIPEDGINTLDDWIQEWREGCILDEYNQTLSAEQMHKRITDRGNAQGLTGNWGGYSSEAEFHRHNHSERGPSGLLRHAIDSRNGCIGHGEGPWDYITGEFS